ncbi:MAG TPA: PAS domain S-box protein [Candidatus Obscuribacterales bacterium]
MQLKLTVWQKGLILVGVPLLFQLALLQTISYLNRQYEAATAWEMRTQQALAQAHEVFELIIDAQTAARGYVLTSNPAFLKPYNRARAVLPAQLQELEDLTHDDPAQTARVNRLASLAAETLTVLEKNVRLVHEGNAAEAVRQIRSGRGEALAEEFRKELARFFNHEEARAAARREQGRQMRDMLNTLLLTGMGATVLLALALLVAIVHDARRRLKILTDNARRLSEGEPLHPEIGGGDELAVLDQAFHQMALSLKESRSKEQLGHEFSQAIIQRAYDAFISIDEASTIIDWNEQAEKTFGWSKEEVVGRSLIETIIPESFRDAHRQGLQRFLKTGEGPVLNKRIELPALHRDGREIPVELGVFPVKKGEHYTFCAFLHDITDRKQAQDAIRASEERIRKAIDHMLVGLAILTPRGIIRSVNPAMEMMFGYEQGELVDTHFMDLFSQQRKRDPDSFVRSTLRRAFGHIVEMNAVKKNGNVFPIELSLSEYHTTEGEFLLANVRDVSERHEADRVKKEFVSVVSHELRTPLTSIRGSLTLIAGGALGELPAEVKEVVGIAERNTLRLINLINEILDLERLESGKLEMRMEDVSVSAIIDRAVESVRALAEEHAITIDVSTQPQTIHADADRLVQVMVNLLSNAIKFSEAGTKVSISHEAGESWLEVRVTDEGRGIPPRFKELIFERFQQVDAADSRQRGGTGLGLAICKAIIEKHHGVIGVESTEGKGSTFWFRLPVSPAVALPEQPPSHPEVVVCVADEETRLLCESVLERSNFSFASVRSAQEALELVKNSPVSLLIADAGSIERPAIDFLEDLRGIVDLSRLPVVFTGNNVVLSAEELSNKMAVHLSQPLREAELVAAISGFLRRAGGSDVLLVEDDPELVALLRHQLSLEGIAVRSAASGKEAVALANREPPALIVLDVGLPEGDGYYVVDQLKQKSHLRTIPMLVYTGRDLTAEQRDKLHLGPTLFLTKAKATDAELKDLVLWLLRTTTPG